MTRKQFDRICHEACRRTDMRHYPDCLTLGAWEWDFLTEREKEEYWKIANQEIEANDE